MRQFELSLHPPPSSSDADSQVTPAEEILEGLNASQQDAVRVTDGPVLIIAGPGSGKTRTLTHRIAYLIATARARPRDILALTFTNKAAREMKDRIRALVGEESRSLWMGTFHSTFARLMRYEGEKIGYSSDFSIYDTDDSERILRQLMDRYSIDTKQYNPRSIRHMLSSAKNRMVSPSEYERKAASAMQDVAAQLFGPYEEMLRASNALDFDDLLIKPIRLFEQHPEVLEKYQNRWKFVHIDEYQDTNRAQYVLANLLSKRHQNLCVVGDDAQSIYAFRGADIGNILSFQRDYADAETVRLEQNYRSTQRILRLADSIIKHNKDQLEKTLWTENPEGEYVTLMEALSEKDEAQKIERTIRDLTVRVGYGYEHFAVLYRTNAQSRSIEDALRRGGIPYRVIGGMSFYQRKEIKDVLAYLRLIVNPSDTASLRRIINYPTRGIGDKTLERIIDFSRERRVTAWEAVERFEEIGLGTRADKAVGAFRDMMKQYIEAAESDTPGEDIARELVKETGMIDELRKEQTTENLMRWENVQELLSAIAEYTAGDPGNRNLSTFLQEVSLMTDLDETDLDEARVTLMTLHASKGLEFPVVFIGGLEEGLFPLARASESITELEEERRLFYVGATRAEERLYLLHARSRFRYGQHESSVRSRFLDEVDVDVVRTESGDRFEQKTNRFAAGPAADEGGYDAMDPHYYRRNLSKKRPKGERTVVYDEGEGEIAPGLTVEHPQFGEGRVMSTEGRGDQAKAVVRFEAVGEKKLMLKYARLRIVES
ncbi:MAG: UvrD-helicase domain-containing protein [Rhodothermales bacterium]